MKKLMIALGVAAFTAAVNAAVINWGGAAGNTGWTPSAEGQYAYLVYTGSSAANLASVITIESESAVGSAVLGSAVKSGDTEIGTVVAYHQIDAAEDEAGYFSATFQRADSAGGVNGYYQIVLADASDENFAVELADAQVTGITDSTGAGSAYYNTDWSIGDNTYVGVNGFNGQFVAAPEPTSGLLLLLGMAGLALRRKRA